MRILITNHNLGKHGGTEMYVRDLAIGLLKRGHLPIVFSMNLGVVAKELITATVPVVDDLSKVQEPPELIHAQHSLESALALLAFPGAPAIYTCHDWGWEHDFPPSVERIKRYVAVDVTVKDRLTEREQIPANKIALLQNAIDLQRFKPRTALPEKPHRAIVFSNYMSPEQVSAIRQACEPLNITVDSAGTKVWNPTSEPEKLLPHYDLVFAKGRCAWESLAVGCSVICCDQQGMGPLVTLDQLEFLKQRNFGRRTLQNPITLENVQREVLRYNASDAQQVSQQIRQSAGLEQLLTQIEQLYNQVLEESQNQSPIALTEEMKSLSRFLAYWWKSQPEFDPYLFAVNASVEANRSQYSAMHHQLSALTQQIEQLQKIQTTPKPTWWQKVQDLFRPRT